MNPLKYQDNSDNHLLLFNDPLQRRRYACSLIMILLMTGVAEILHEKEIIFPEIAALIIGMWIVDKRVWHIEAGQMLSLMTLGACTGVLLVLYSSFGGQRSDRFSVCRAKSSIHPDYIIPMISVCVLPVL